MTTTTKTTGRKMTKKQRALTDAAIALFNTTEEKIPAVLWALGIRQTCGRCGGSGEYSYNQIHGSRCYGCNGRREVAAKLTEETFALAGTKVEAGELEAYRARARALKQAKREIGPLVERAREALKTIGDAYTVLSKTEAFRASWTGSTFDAPVYRAQTMNGAIFYGTHGTNAGWYRQSISGIESDIRSGRRTDYLVAKAEIEERLAWLEALGAAWLAFVGGAS